MAEDLGRAILVLSTDQTQLRSGLQSAERGARSLEQRFTSSASRINLSLRTIATTLATVTAVRFGERLVQSTINTASAFETLNVRLTSLRGSLQAVAADTKFITDFTAKTPLELEGVSNAFVRLTAAGLDARKILPGLTEGLAAFGGTDEVLNRIVTQLTQMVAKNRVLSEDLRIIAETGLPVYDILQQKLKLSDKAMADLANSGVSAKQAILAIAEGAGERFQGAAEALSRSWIGIMSNIRDQWTLLVKAVFDAGLFDFLKAGADLFRERFTQAFADNQEAAADFSNAVITGIKNIILTVAGLIDVFRTLQTTMQGLSAVPVFNQISAAIDNLIEQATALGKVLRGELSLGDVFKSSREELQKLLKESAATPELAGPTVQAAQDLFQQLDERRALFAREREAFAARAKPIREIPDRPAFDKKAAQEAEDQAKRIAKIFTNLKGEQQAVVALGQALGESYARAAEEAQAVENAIHGLFREGLRPATEPRLAGLISQLQQLRQAEIGETLQRQLATIDRQAAIFGDTLQTGEARIEAYRTAITDLGNRVGETARPQIDTFKQSIDALEGSLARQQAATRVGDAYRAFAAAVQESAQEFTIFGDVNARVSRDIQSLQTLLQALIREGWEPTSAAVQAVVAQLNALQVPDLGRLLAPIARQAQLLQRTSPLAAPFDVLGAQVSAIRGELERLANDPSINLHSESVQRLSERYQELANRLDFRETARSSFRSINEAFDDLVRGVLEGSQTIEEALKKLPEALILSFTRRMIDAVLIPVENAFIRLVEQLSEFGFAGLFGGAVATRPLTLPNVPSIGGQHGAQFTVGGQGGPDSQFVPILATPGEKVFIVPPHQPLTMDALQRLPRFQSGGTFTVGSPPVAARPPGQAAGPGVIVNIQNHSSAQIKTQERRGPKGERQLDVVIEEMVARSLSKPGSAAQSALRNNFQITPGLIGR